MILDLRRMDLSSSSSSSSSHLGSRFLFLPPHGEPLVYSRTSFLPRRVRLPDSCLVCDN
jgi:hypothetical protein